MKRSVFSSIALVALMQAATGCIITSSDDGDDAPPPPPPDGIQFEVTAVCPGDASTFEVSTINTATGQGFYDTFDCGDLGIILVDPGTYDMRVEAFSDVDDAVYGSTALENFTGVDGDTLTAQFEFPTDAGFFWLSWDIVDGATDLTCADAAAAGISVTSSISGDPNSGIDDILKCHYGAWQTGELDLGNYEVSVAAIDEADEVIAAAQSIAATLTFCGQVYDLGNVVLDISL